MPGDFSVPAGALPVWPPPTTPGSIGMRSGDRASAERSLVPPGPRGEASDRGSHSERAPSGRTPATEPPALPVPLPAVPSPAVPLPAAPLPAVPPPGATAAVPPGLTPNSGSTGGFGTGRTAGQGPEPAGQGTAVPGGFGHSGAGPAGHAIGPAGHAIGPAGHAAAAGPVSGVPVSGEPVYREPIYEESAAAGGRPGRYGEASGTGPAGPAVPGFVPMSPGVPGTAPTGPDQPRYGVDAAAAPAVSPWAPGIRQGADPPEYPGHVYGGPAEPPADAGPPGDEPPFTRTGSLMLDTNGSLTGHIFAQRWPEQPEAGASRNRTVIIVMMIVIMVIFVGLIAVIALLTGGL
jgi:hypothetical protein